MSVLVLVIFSDTKGIFSIIVDPGAQDIRSSIKYVLTQNK